MKRFFLLLMGISLTLALSAQTENDGRSYVMPIDSIDECDDGHEVVDGVRTEALEPIADIPVATLPLGRWAAPGGYGFAPWSAGFLPAWNLHEGFNAQLGMSVTAGFGKHAPRGVGFGQSAAFAYAGELSPRFSAAVGVYADHIDGGGYQATDGGVAASLRYRLNDSVNLYAYVTKSFLSSAAERARRGFSPYGPPMPRDRIGAMAEFKVGKNALIQVSVERNEY